VKFINTDGMAFIGPGSEWFWTALSGIILAVTFIAIYRQLRIQAGTRAFEQLDGAQRELYSERNLRYQLDIYVALRDGVDQAALPRAAATTLGNFWETYAMLARRGHLDPKVLWHEYSNVVAMWWATLAPTIRTFRTQTGNPQIFDEFEWLAELMAAMDRRAGAPAFDASRLTLDLGGRIASIQDRLRVEQSLRTVILASPDMEVITQPAPAAPSA
jgi:hypothetical protein